MSPDKQRIAIAEACGWKVSPSIKGPYDGCPCGTLPPLRNVQPIPDYLNDLNAMHEAENDLSPVLRSIYCDFLMYGRANPDPRPEVFGRWQTVNATAAQRAESFLRTIGKWEENQ